MDNYTEKTRNWLDDRFRETTDEGIYFAHQPIYGFRNGHSEEYVIQRYMITYQIMKALAHLKFNSLLDVGGAEGYKAALARELFDAKVRSCDLSNEACNRAKEIFGVEGEVVDIHQLPYDDDEFDIVVCSETLEHVPDIQTAVKELLRVSKNSVIISVPHESKETIEKNIKENIPHSHLHCLDVDSFDYTLSIVQKIIVRKILVPVLNIPCAIVESKKRKKGETNYSSASVRVYNFFRPLFHFVFGKNAAAFLVWLDDLFSRLNMPYYGLVFVLLKSKESYYVKPRKHLSASRIVDFKVPYYYMKK